MNVNIEESIVGLWVANRDFSYLAFWFPILEKPNGNFIEIKPGMNVIYGLNGSGKTQLLEAISSTAEFKMSTFEGFILKDPKVESDGQKSDKKLYDISSQDVLNYYESISKVEYPVDMMLGFLAGYKPENLTDENREEVKAIISEFLSNKKCLLTRAMPQSKQAVDLVSSRENMNPAESIDFVPILLKRDEAPITRSHLEKISQSYLKFKDNLPVSLKGIQGLDLQNYEIVDKKKTELFQTWLQSWDWSPLVNLRNFGFFYSEENGELFDEYNNSEFGFLNSDALPIFLPAIHSYLNPKEYQEFKEEEWGSEYTLSLKKETRAQEDINSEQFSITRADLRAPFGEIEESKRKSLLAEYLVNLRKKINFLPGLRMLTINFELPRDNEGIPLIMSTRHSPRASSGSDAEKRWVLLGMKAMRQSTKWLVIDEPERGMHRTAEAELAGVLSSPEWTTSNILVVATHSPEFLNLPNVNIIHIVKGSTFSLTKSDREKFIDLGIRPSDLLAGIKIFLLVEGEHEKIIFESLFKDELDRMKCRIIVARGAKNMRDIFESEFIFHYTDAVIISVLDNIDSKQVENVWNESKRMAQTGRIREVGQYVRHSLKGSKSGESLFLSEFLTQALVYGQHERVEVWGLSKPDIVFYFEPSDFGLKESWKELLKLNEIDKQSFKGWATKKFGADFSTSAIEKAALTCNSSPVDFVDLMFKIAEIANSKN